MGSTKTKKNDKTEIESASNGFEFEVGDRSFPMKRIGVTYFAMKLAKAEKKANAKPPHPNNPDVGPCQCERCVRLRADQDAAGYEVLSAMYAAMLAMVDDDHHDELEEYLATSGLPAGELEEAIAKAMGLQSGGLHVDSEGKA